MNSAPDFRTLIFRIILVAGYLCAGSGIFFVLEKNNDIDNRASNASRYYNETIKQILRRCSLNDSEMEAIIGELRRVLPPQPVPIPWSFAGGMELAIQTITTIGYGTRVPKTVQGRMFLILYAVVGIPLMAMMLTSISQKTRRHINSLIQWYEKKVLKRRNPQHVKGKSLITICVLSVACLLIVSAISTAIEKDWDFHSALYFWFVTFTTIGFGDFYPSGSGNHTWVVLESIFISFMFFFGLSLIATIVSSVSDWLNTAKVPASSKYIMRSISSSARTQEVEMSEIKNESKRL